MELGLNKLPWYGQIAAFLLVAVAGFIVFHFYWVVPQQDDMTIRRQELTQKQQDISRALQTAGQLPEFEAEVEALGVRLEGLKAVLPQEKDAGALLRRLQALATQSNLSIRSFTPQAALMQELHSEWPSRLELNGTYHNLGVFFDRVSKFSQIINISDVSIRAIDPAPLNATITAECTATTFVLNEGSAEAGEGPVS